MFVALAAGQSHVLLDDGAHFSLDDPRLQSLRALIEEARALQDAPSAPLRISRYQAGALVRARRAGRGHRAGAGLAAAGGDAARAGRARRARSARDDRRRAAPLPARGLRLAGGALGARAGRDPRRRHGPGQDARDARARLPRPCPQPRGRPVPGRRPTSVVSGWVDEAARFAPSLRVEAVVDTLAKSGRTIEELAGADVVVTTYTLLRLDADAYRAVEWAGVVLDEAQYVKNHQAKTYRCVRELQPPFKLALTGTPMENNLMELWSLLSIVAPGLFPDPKRFAAEYARPIERRGDLERLARLRRRIKPLVKRRSKELVAADLPAKQEQTLLVDLHPRHRKLYDTYLQRERQKILGLLSDFDRNRFTILRSITLLRQLSLHPEPRRRKAATAFPARSSTRSSSSSPTSPAAATGRSCSASSPASSPRCASASSESSIGYCYLDGRTRQRERVLERFRAGDDPVFLISLKAGGFGLNLTEADYCFLLDPWWNPATENQAIDRTHRIGQTRPVNVYRLIARDTIEEKVVALARRKADLFRGVMDDGDLFASSLTADDIRGLLE